MFPTRPFRVPPTIQFGVNAAAQAGAEAQGLEAKKALLVTDKVLINAGVIQPVIESLDGSGIKVEIFDAVDSEPTLAHVDN